MHYTGKVTVRFKKSVLEPQGKAIALSLHERGASDLKMIRVGKLIEVEVEASTLQEAQKRIEEIADQVLYNPVMEVCEISVSEGSLSV